MNVKNFKPICLNCSINCADCALVGECDKWMCSKCHAQEECMRGIEEETQHVNDN